MLPPMISGAATASRSHEVPSKPPSRYEKIWRSPVPERYIAIASPAASSEPTAYPVRSRDVSGASGLVRDRR